MLQSVLHFPTPAVRSIVKVVSTLHFVVAASDKEKKVSMGLWHLGQAVHISTFLRITINVLPLQLSEILEINCHHFN